MEATGNFVVRVIDKPYTPCSPVGKWRTISNLCTKAEAIRLAQLLDNGSFHKVGIEPTFTR